MHTQEKLRHENVEILTKKCIFYQIIKITTKSQVVELKQRVIIA
jgi:hypothetical protein